MMNDSIPEHTTRSLKVINELKDMKGGYSDLLKRIYSGLIKVNARAHSKAIQRLCEEIEPDVEGEDMDTSSVTSEDMMLMITADDSQMDVEYPFMDLINSEYQYVVPSKATCKVEDVEESPSHDVDML